MSCIGLINFDAKNGAFDNVHESGIIGQMTYMDLGHYSMNLANPLPIPCHIIFTGPPDVKTGVTQQGESYIEVKVQDATGAPADSNGLSLSFHALDPE